MPHFRPLERLLQSGAAERSSGTVFKAGRHALRGGRVSAVKGLLAVMVVVGLLGSAMPSEAQDLAEEIKELQEEREQLKEEQTTKARDIDVSTAEANELAAALGVLNGQVNAQEDSLEQAQVQLGLAEQRFAEASQAVIDKAAEIDRLKVQVSERAISAFVGQNVGSSPVLEDADPNQAIRMQSLVESVTSQEFDVAEQLREAREDLAIEEARAAQAADEATQFRAAIEAELLELQSVRDDQARLLNEAEDRLEAQLYEAAVMAERDKEIAAGITERNAELQRQAALARQNNPAPATRTSTSYPTADEIVKVGPFWVHIDIANNVQALLDHATSDGITFGGWGYRDHATQIRLRKEHCGTSEYAIWSMPSSQCQPPTARPGRSQHELGLAIDFTYNGSSIGTRSSPGYQWLAAHAATYGLYNLPSEPWHWSVNGN